MLHLILTGKWYDAIASGEKTVEYRDFTAYWIKRIPNQTLVMFHRGYTKTTMLFKIKAIYIGDTESGKIEIYLGERMNK